MDAHERRTLPEGWQIKRIKDFAEVITGGTPSTIIEEYWTDGTIPWLPSGDLKNCKITEAHKFITKLGLDNSAAKVMPKKTVLIALTGATTGQTGLMEIEASANQSVTGILPSNEHFPEYLFYYLQTLRKKIKDLSYGGAQPHISQGFVKNIDIILPPLAVQKKVAAILEKVEETKKLRAQADELTDRLLQSVFLEIFGDPVGNPKGFDFIKLEAVYSREKSGTKCGPFGSALKKDEHVNYGIPVLTMDNICDNKFIDEYKLYITNEKYEQLRPYSVEKGDIIISRAGTVGKMCVAKPSIYPSIIDTNLIRLSLDSSKIESIYFTSLMTFFKGRVGRLQTGVDGAYTFMNTGVLDNLGLYLPPLPLQQKFARIVEKVESMRQSQNQSKQQIENLFSALMQKAFRGELET